MNNNMPVNNEIEDINVELTEQCKHIVVYYLFEITEPLFLMDCRKSVKIEERKCYLTKEELIKSL